MTAVTVSRCDEQLIAVKQTSAERAAHLEREAEMLRRLAHPGLVRFVDLVETPDGGRALHTEFVNADTWATRPLSDPAERAAGMAALAAVVADLHQLGVAHLQLNETHVLHGADDRPVLCSLSRADEASPENCQRDLAALAELCHDSSLGKSVLAGKLLAVADAARGGLIGAREMARRLDLLAAKKSTRNAKQTSRAAQASDAAGNTAISQGNNSNSVGRSSQIKRLAVGAALGVAIFAGFALGSRSVTINAPEPSPETSPEASRMTTDFEDADTSRDVVDALQDAVDAPQGTEDMGARGYENSADQEPADDMIEGNSSEHSGRAATATATATATVSISGLASTADSTVGSEASALQAAALLAHEGRRYALGAAGDFVEMGDWDCDGTATPALVRPSNGAIVLFDEWPEPGETLALPQRWRIDHPTGVETVTNGECDLLRVYTINGSKLFDPSSEDNLFTATQIFTR